MKINKRKIKFVNSRLQRNLLILVFVSATIPAAIIAVCMYYMIFNMVAWQIGIPEAIAYNVLPVAQRVSTILMISLPVVLFLILLIALEISHKVAGPLVRLERELDDIIEGKKESCINVRKGDEFESLVHRINKLICKKEQK